MEWGVEQGVWCPGWTIKEQSSGDRCAIATEEIEEGAVLCRVPRMSAWVVTEDEPPRVPASFLYPGYWLSDDVKSEKGWFLKLAAKLLYEKHLGVGSKWFPYIQMLPTHIDTLVHWSDRELLELQSPRLMEEVQQSRAWLEEAHAEFCSFLALSAPVPFEEFRWALDCVRSRTFKHKAQWAMLPLADMFNHHSAARESKFEYNELLDAFDLCAAAPVQAGGEVGISYGALTNNKLLAFYAFCEDDNPWDTLSVPEESVLAFFEADARAAERAPSSSTQEQQEAAQGQAGGGGADLWARRVAVVEALRRFKYLPPAPARYHVLAGGEVQPELELLLQAVRLPAHRLLLAAPRTLALQLGERAPPPSDPFAFPPPPSPAALQAAVSAAMADLSRALAAEAGSSLAQDHALLAQLRSSAQQRAGGGGGTEEEEGAGERRGAARLELAVRFRVGKKRLLALIS